VKSKGAVPLCIVLSPELILEVKNEVVSWQIRQSGWAYRQPLLTLNGSPGHLNRFLEYSYRVRSLKYAMPLKEEE
jgi:hypothetical protein